ncbi:NADPH-dependent FMN reductase [Flavobacterium sp. FPG59]|uniref:NADPH-dependent FMN reductase n=1 Tax=Flavobacterium sp. FPG59 TaxID=1929267 RepID=UPI000A364C4E|nr:NADPH-dependent FMN reductase [Flavobacterium sp. FPG59]OUD29164.1 FMN reductase [Flavobacterium sp. FPG59]
MSEKKNIFAIIGSASANSSNLKLVEKIASLTTDIFDLTIFSDLKSLPHFDPELSADNPPRQIKEFRNNIEQADGIIICTPEYVFSIPSGLKNAIEWCIATTIFENKPSGLITASANGEKGHEELQLIMKTAMVKFKNETTLLIQGVKGKFDTENNLIDTKTTEELNGFINEFNKLVRQ